MNLDEATHDRIQNLVRSDRVVLFMKGTRTAPQCGFSAATVGILDSLLPDYTTYNVLEDQGVRVELTARVEDGTLGELRFRAWGCPHLLAAAEAFCDDFEGHKLSELDAFQAVEIMQTLPVPTEKTGRILVLEDAVRLLAQRIGGNPDQ